MVSCFRLPVLQRDRLRRDGLSHRREPDLVLSDTHRRVATKGRNHWWDVDVGGDAAVHLWTQDRLPGWMEQVPLEVRWSFHRRKLFEGDAEAGWVQLPTQVRDWTMQGSAPERAILEVLSQVDETPTAFTFAAELFEGLTSLRPAVVNTLLQSCLHNEAKRLFLFFATRYDYPWLKHVEVDAVDLGRGKRLVTRGGKLDKRYQITVPEAFHAG